MQLFLFILYQPFLLFQFYSLKATYFSAVNFKSKFDLSSFSLTHEGQTSALLAPPQFLKANREPTSSLSTSSQLSPGRTQASAQNLDLGGHPAPVCGGRNVTCGHSAAFSQHGQGKASQAWGDLWEILEKFQQWGRQRRVRRPTELQRSVLTKLKLP